MGEKQPPKQGIKGKKQSKTNRATRLRRGLNLVGDVHIFVHKFVI